MPKAKCPTCATVVTYVAGYDPICPSCGFRGAAPALPTTQAPQHGLALGALVCGLVGFAFPPLAIVAIILGGIALSQADRDPQRPGGKGMAIAGLVLGIIVVAFWLVFFGSISMWDVF